MISEPVLADSRESLGLLQRVRRAWQRDSHLSLVRRLEKGLLLAAQLVRARLALTACDRVGANARVAGRLRVLNHGSIVIGDHLNINSTWVPTELLTGPSGSIEIGDDVLVNFGTVIAAASGVRIGTGSMIGPHCIISDVEIPEAASEPESAGRPIVIGRDVWIAGRVTIRPGVTIGDGAVVVAGSIVEADVPAQVMAVGIPARLLPKLAAGPRIGTHARTAIPGRDSLSRSATNREQVVKPATLKGTLMSDFALDELADELAMADDHAPGAEAVLAQGPIAQLLGASPALDARDFLILWTRPSAVVPAFARFMAGDPVDETQLIAEVDDYCSRVAQSASGFNQVFIPTWTQPSYSRGHGVFDARPGGGLMALSAMNLRLMTNLGQLANVFVLDAARWQAAVGPSASNPRGWYLGQRIATRSLMAEAARDLRAALASLRGQQRHLLVLESQAALWNGHADDKVGSSESRQQAFADFQCLLLILKRSGVILAVTGPVEETELRRSIRSDPGVMLREEDLVVGGGEGGDEAATLEALVRRLGVALDSVVYIAPSELIRARVRGALPAVYVPDWPKDLLLYPSALQSLRCFDRTLSGTPQLQ